MAERSVCGIRPFFGSAGVSPAVLYRDTRMKTAGETPALPNPCPTFKFNLSPPGESLVVDASSETSKSQQVPSSMKTIFLYIS